MEYDFPTIVPKFDAVLARGLCEGVGSRDGQMCIEAAICAALDLPHGDDPECVSRAVRLFKIRLNDSPCWKNPQSRADGLRRLGIAQIGSRGVVDDREFSRRLSEATIRKLLPDLWRRIWPNDEKMLAIALRCEQEGSVEAARDAANAAAAYAAYAANAAAAYAADAADAAADAAAAYAAAAANAAYAADAEHYLRLSADLALQVLIDLKSPGALWLVESEAA